MEKDLSFFFADVAEAKVTEIEIVVSERFKADGEVIPWRFRIFNADEIDDIKKQSTKVIKRNGAKTLTIDTTLLTQTVILESVIYPNLKDTKLQESYGTLTNRELLKKILTGPELERLGDKILKAQGFMEDINALIDDAKN